MNLLRSTTYFIILLSFLIVGCDSTSLNKLSSESLEENLDLDAPNSVDHLAFNPQKHIPIKDIKEKVFLFRRTLIDAPHAFAGAYPGMHGQIIHVRFALEAQGLDSNGRLQYQLAVKRNKPLAGSLFTSALDTDTLMAFRVEFYKKIGDGTTSDVTTEASKDSAAKTASGRTSITSLKKDKDKVMMEVIDSPTQEGAIAVVDWSQNIIPITASPIAYFAPGGSCLLGKSSKFTDDFDNRLSENGVFNFTIQGSYALSPWQKGCVKNDTPSNAGFVSYFYPNQNHFTLRERISFKVHNSVNDTKHISNLTAMVAKQLGIGLFTFEKKKLNSFGNSWTKYDRQDVHMLHDFSKPKVYILGGLPKSGERRELMIKATKTSMAQWNQALHRAFKDSSLERADKKYLILQVEGQDETQGQFGDLDRNYIYCVEKNFNHGILGMAGPSVNRESGLIEASDVVLFTGELLSYLEYEQENARAVKSYKDNKERVATEWKPLLNGKWYKKSIFEEASSPTAIPQEVDGVSMTDIRLFLGLPPDETQSMDSDQSSLKQTDPPYQANTIMYKNIFKGKVPRLSSAWSHLLDRNEKSIPLLSPQKLRDKSTVIQVAEKVFNNNLSRGEVDLTIKYALLEKYKSFISQNEYKKLKAHLEREQFLDQLYEKLADNQILVEKIESSYFDKKLLNENINEAFAIYFQKTLSHEIGHALGLAHNFAGSYDKKNWHFEDEKDSSRQHSTVMDYLTHSTEEGPGPWDIYTLRAAYTDRFEVLPEYEKQIGKKYITSKEIFKKLGIESWTDWNGADLHPIIPFKKYEFCNSLTETAPFTCQIYDQGTTPSEIVKYWIDRYQSTYSLRNFRKDRKKYNWRRDSSYFRSIWYFFSNIRKLTDHTKWLASRLEQSSEGLSPEEGQGLAEDVVNAIYIGRDFFESVVRTPEIQTTYEPFSMDSKTGEAFERKRSTHKYLKATSEERQVQGIELDKLIALVMLSMKSLAQKTSEDFLGSASYVDYEKIMFPYDNVAYLPTLKLLGDILGLRLKPAYLNSVYKLTPLNDYSPTDERNYETVKLTTPVIGVALWAALDFLKSESVEKREEDFSQLFAVNSSSRFSDLKDVTSNSTFHVPYVSHLDTLSTDKSATRYWPRSHLSAWAYQNITATLAAQDIYYQKESYARALSKYFNFKFLETLLDKDLIKLDEVYEKMIVKFNKDNPDFDKSIVLRLKDKKELKKFLDINRKEINAKLLSLQESISPRNVDILYNYMLRQVELAYEIVIIFSQLDPRSIADLDSEDSRIFQAMALRIDQQMNYNKNLVIQRPIYALAQSALVDVEVFLPEGVQQILSKIIDSRIINQQARQLFQVIQSSRVIMKLNEEVWE